MSGRAGSEVLYLTTHVLYWKYRREGMHLKRVGSTELLGLGLGLFPMVCSLTLVHSSGTDFVSPSKGGLCFAELHLARDVKRKNNADFGEAGPLRFRPVGTDRGRFVFVVCENKKISVGRGAVPRSACRDRPSPRQAFGRAPST